MPAAPPPVRPQKFNFIYGHRKPSQNRPTVRGGLFSNRQSLKPQKQQQQNPYHHYDLSKWDPHNPQPQLPTSTSTTTPNLSFLSPIARFITDAFRRHHSKWGSPLVDDLHKLRRVTPDLVAEVLKVQTDPSLASKFFHWAGKQKGYRHTFASYNAFAYCLNRANRYRSADQVPELMEAQGKPPSEKQFEILIRMHSDANRGLRVYHVYEKMKKFGVKPRVFLFNRVMDALVRTGYLDLSLSVYEDFKEAGLIEESVTFMILIKGLCKAGRTDEMLEVLGRMRGELCRPDVFAYTAMVKVMVGEGNLDGCLRVWEEMRKDGVVPDVIAYGTVIAGLCKGGRVEKGYELFKEMKEKGVLIDRAVYGALVKAFVEDRKVGLACDVFKDLVDSGYRADLDIYSFLIQGLCNEKRVDKAYKLFQVTVQEGLGPNFETVNLILMCYAEMRRMDEFRELLVQMQKLGLPVIYDLAKFFTFVVRKGDGVKLALEVFEDLKVRGYCSVAIYNILMEALYKNGMAKKALLLLNEVKDMNVQPDASTYSVAIECFVEEGDVKEACACHNKIVDMSCVPSVSAYCCLARGLCNIGEIDAAMMLVRDCLASVSSGPMEFKYALTILHACKSGKAEKVIEVLDEMMQEGCPSDNVVYSAVISGMCKHGTIEEARKVFSNLRQHKLLSEARMIVYDEVLIEHMKQKTADLVISGLKFFGVESKLKAKGSKLLSH